MILDYGTTNVQTADRQVLFSREKLNWMAKATRLVTLGLTANTEQTVERRVRAEGLNSAASSNRAPHSAQTHLARS